MRVAVATLVIIATATLAHAMLRGSPRIHYVAIDATDEDTICIKLEYAPFGSALSTNAGLTFETVKDQDIPPGLTTNLSTVGRRYILVDRINLFRSDDEGKTWTNTAASSFIQHQIDHEIRWEQEEFQNAYHSRLPDRSVFWHPILGVFAAVYFVTTVFLLGRQGRISAYLTAARGLIMIVLIGCVLWGFHQVVRHWTDSQYPGAYWNTSGLFQPSAKLGLVMAIAARPLPLLVYLLALWPLLPGSSEALRALSPAILNRRWTILAFTLEAAGFILFHVWVLFVGYFRE